MAHHQDAETDRTSRTDVSELSAHILNTLRSTGYAHITQPMSLNCFQMISRQMGSIELRTEVAINKTHDLAQQRRRVLQPDRPGVYGSGALGFHTDNPKMSVVGWYCLRQDDVAGASLLLDTSDLEPYFSADELTILGTIHVRCTVPGQVPEAFFLEPLVSTNSTGYNVYYVPWLLLDSDSYGREQSLVLEKFSEYVKHKETTQLISLRLQEQECLFIDNRRMLHARNAIAEDSQRHLVRLWIRTEPLR